MNVLFLLLIVAAVIAAIYVFNRRPDVRKALAPAVGVMIAAFVVAAMAFPQAFTLASALTLEIDVQPLFDAIQDYVPLFFGILAIGGGIAIGLSIARFVINSVKSAFDGKSI